MLVIEAFALSTGLCPIAGYLDLSNLGYDGMLNTQKGGFVFHS